MSSRIKIVKLDRLHIHVESISPGAPLLKDKKVLWFFAGVHTLTGKIPRSGKSAYGRALVKSLHVEFRLSFNLSLDHY